MAHIQLVGGSAWGTNLGVTNILSLKVVPPIETVRQRVRYVLLKNQKDLNAPVVLHFHGTGMDLTVY